MTVSIAARLLGIPETVRLGSSQRAAVSPPHSGLTWLGRNHDPGIPLGESRIGQLPSGTSASGRANTSSAHHCQSVHRFDGPADEIGVST